MPYISLTISSALTADQKRRIAAGFEAIMSDVLGKPKEWVMTAFEDNVSHHFRGTESPCAFVNLRIFGEVSAEKADCTTKEVCALITSVCGVDGERIFVCYYSAQHMGWNGGNF